MHPPDSSMTRDWSWNGFRVELGYRVEEVYLLFDDLQDIFFDNS